MITVILGTLTLIAWSITCILLVRMQNRIYEKLYEIEREISSFDYRSLFIRDTVYKMYLMMDEQKTPKAETEQPESEEK